MDKAPTLSPRLLRRIHSGVTLLAIAALLLAVFALGSGSWIFVLPYALALIAMIRISSALSEALSGVSEEDIQEPYVVRDAKEETPSRARAPESVVVAERSEPDDEWRTVRSGGKAHVAAAAKQEPAGPSWTETIDWEEWVGKKLLQKLGIVIVLIGMLVFMKFSFDNGWIGELGRIALSTLAAAALLGAGEWFAGKYANWSHAFTGGGLVLLYFTVWVAHDFYAAQLLLDHGLVITAPMAMGLYTLITALGVLASVRYNAQIIAWFALVGGYLTPELISTPNPSAVGMVVYLGILAAGLLGLSWWKRWKYLNLASFALTQLYLVGMIYPLSDTIFTDMQQAVTATVFYVIFGILPFLYQFRLKLNIRQEDVVLTIANAVIVYGAVVDAVGGIASEYVGLISLALAAVQLGYASLALRARAEDDTLINTHLVAGTVLVSLALLAELKWEWVAAGWAPFSALLVFVAARVQRAGPWRCATILLVLSLVALFFQIPAFHVTGEEVWYPLTSSWAIQNYIVFASVVAWLLLSRKVPSTMLGKQSQVSLGNTLHGALAALLFTAVTLEATRLDFVVDMPWTIAMLLFAGLAIAIFAAVGSVVWFIAACIGQLLALLFIFVLGNGSGMVSPIFDGPLVADPLLHPWAGLSVIALVMTFAIGYVVSVRGRGLNHPDVRTALIAAALAQVWVHGSVEIQHLAMQGPWFAEHVGRMLSAWWIAFAAAAMAWALYTGNARLRAGAIALLAIPLFKDILVIFETHRFLEAIVWTVGPLTLAVIGSRMKKEDVLKAGVLFLCLTAAADMLSHLGAGEGLVRTVWWALAALVTIIAGFSERQTLLRRVGIVLFGAVTVKLLLFDFAALSTGVRIGASIGTGLLMIGASYLYQRFGEMTGAQAASARKK